MLHYPYFLFPLGLCASAFIVRKVQQRNRPPLPPSPPSEPFIGHLRVMPMEYEWKTFSDWGKKLGKVVSSVDRGIFTSRRLNLRFHNGQADYYSGLRRGCPGSIGPESSKLLGSAEDDSTW